VFGCHVSLYHRHVQAKLSRSASQNSDMQASKLEHCISDDMLQNSGSRIRIAGRFKSCVHMGSFDLQTFVELNQRSRKVRFCSSICQKKTRIPT
jgi:hypothetical protein